MKFTTNVKLSVEIKNFERFDNIEFDYVEFTDEMKREVASAFDPKKFRVVFDLTHIDPEGDGYSVHATASHRKKSKFEINETSDGVFQLLGEAEILLSSIVLTLSFSLLSKNLSILNSLSSGPWFLINLTSWPNA